MKMRIKTDSHELAMKLIKMLVEEGTDFTYRFLLDEKLDELVEVINPHELVKVFIKDILEEKMVFKPNVEVS